MEDKMIFDRKKLMNRLGGDVEIVNSLLTDYLKDIPRQIADLRNALANEDTKQVCYLAHTLKGVALYASAPTLAQAADRVYTAAKNDDLPHARASFLDIGLEFERWQEYARKELRADGAAQ